MNDKEVFKPLTDPKLIIPYEISNTGRVRYTLPSGEHIYLETIDDGIGDRYVRLLRISSYEFVAYSVNALIERTFGKSE